MGGVTLILINAHVKLDILGSIAVRGNVTMNATNKAFARKAHVSVTKATQGNFVIKKIVGATPWNNYQYSLPKGKGTYGTKKGRPPKK